MLKERWKVARYVRYVDDLCVCHDDKGYLTDLRASIREWLLPERLRLNARGVARQRRRARVLAHDLARGAVTPDDVRASWLAWVAHAAHGDTWRLVRDVRG